MSIRSPAPRPRSTSARSAPPTPSTPPDAPTTPGGPLPPCTTKVRYAPMTLPKTNAASKLPQARRVS